MHLAACLRILHGLKDLLKVCEGVATRCTEKGAREAVLVGLRDHPGDVTEHCLQRAAAAALLIIEQGPRGIKLELIITTVGPLNRTRRRGVRHRGDSGLNDIAFLQSCIPPARELRVIFLELDELFVYLRQLCLDLIQLVLVRILQETADIVLGDLEARNAAELIREETQDAFHLVDPLDVLFVRPHHLTRIHVLELHLRIVADHVHELPCPVNGQHQGAMLHRFRPKDPHL
mmetsp:Transcript_15812/g.40196  ORF Transcript_15812/g.40196 Transcript_15812/m.40196 type:complete len:232 (+) Transcript_15812:1381-2076(+)